MSKENPLEIFESSNGALESYAVPERQPGGDEKIRSITWTWATHVHSPIYWKNARLTCWDNGNWEFSCTVKNDSGHSDWDVWIDPLFFKSNQTNGVAFNLTGEICFQDLDHGEEYNKLARGWSREVLDLYPRMDDKTIGPSFRTWKRRDDKKK